MPDPALVTPADVRAAAERLEGVIHATPLDSSRTLAERTGASSAALKLENLQRAGSFKVRGAYNRISRLSDAERAAGVVTVSAGNHAQGVALAAAIHGVDATVVMPAEAPAAKVAATEGYGAEVLQGGTSYADLRERADRLIDERGLTMVHPFADPAVIAGQGTLGLEVAAAAPEADLVLVPIGGGGLASGVGVALSGLDREVEVVAVETEGTAHAARAMADGEVHVVDEIDTIAEGIAAGQTEPYTLAHLVEHVDAVVQVTDADAKRAMAFLAARAKTVAEPAGALPVAALLAGAVDAADRDVVAVVSGGNVDLEDYARWLAEAG